MSLSPLTATDVIKSHTLIHICNTTDMFSNQRMRKTDQKGHTKIHMFPLWSAMAQWYRVGLRCERSGVRNLPSPWCVIEQDTLLPKVLVIPRKRWLFPDMTEKMLTEMLSLNTNNKQNIFPLLVMHANFASADLPNTDAFLKDGVFKIMI